VALARLRDQEQPEDGADERQLNPWDERQQRNLEDGSPSQRPPQRVTSALTTVRDPGYGRSNLYELAGINAFPITR
jgi:hypothetical protein